MMPLLSSSFGNGVPSAEDWDRLVEQDHPADVLLHAGGGEEQVAVAATSLFGGLDFDRVEALLDRPVALVGGEDSLAGRNKLARGLFQALVSHGQLLPQLPLRVFPYPKASE